jgi:glycosyltransferase involved in cell wall biosynthesis
MKMALVCDDLIQHGGAENVTLAICEMWKDAPLYTSVASNEWIDICKKRGIDLRTSFMQKIPFAAKFNRYLSPFLLHTLAFQSFDFSKYDLVFSMSSRFAHQIITQPQTKHICYMHSPGRMFWEPKDYFERESYGFLRPIKKFAIIFLALPLLTLRIIDYIFAKKIDYIICNSETSKARVKKYYGMSSDLINPFADVVASVSASSNRNKIDEKYFLVITRLAPWKKIEIAIEACERLKMPLKIIGGGVDMKRLKKFSGANTEFLGPINDASKFDYIKRCQAVIITQLEDFGIVPLEAMSLGKPVIAYKKGGVLETILPGVTGDFFNEQTSDSLLSVIENFDTKKYNSQSCMNRAKEFSKEKFQLKIKNYLDNVYL